VYYEITRTAIAMETVYCSLTEECSCEQVAVCYWKCYKV